MNNYFQQRHLTLIHSRVCLINFRNNCDREVFDLNSGLNYKFTTLLAATVLFLWIFISKSPQNSRIVYLEIDPSKRSMNSRDQSPSLPSSEPVYGFLCPETNTFYAFDTLEAYHEFLAWCQDHQQGKPATIGQGQQSNMTSEQDLKAQCEMVTAELMKVVQEYDNKQQDEEEMKQIDF